jgi:protein TonB
MPEMFGQVVSHRARARNSIVAVFASVPGLIVATVVGATFFTFVLPMPVAQAITYVAVDIRLPRMPAVATRSAEAKPSTPNVDTRNTPPLSAPDGLKPEVARAVDVLNRLPPGEISGDDLPATSVIVSEVKAPPPAPPAASDVQKPVIVGGAIKAPTRIKSVNPVYPPIAQSAHIQGIVIIEATIGIGGDVQDAKILRSIPLLDAAAIDAVKQWRFSPTLLNGQPVPVIMTVTVNFTLQ